MKRGGRAPRSSTVKKKTLKVSFSGWGILSSKGRVLEVFKVDDSKEDCSSLCFALERLDGQSLLGSTIVLVSAVLEQTTRRQCKAILRSLRSL